MLPGLCHIRTRPDVVSLVAVAAFGPIINEAGLRVKMCVWLGVSRGLDLAFLNAD